MIKDRFKSKEYLEVVQSFIEFATKNLGLQDEIRCPCVDCWNDTKFSRQVVRLHLIRRGITCSYCDLVAFVFTFSIVLPIFMGPPKLLNSQVLSLKD